MKQRDLFDPLRAGPSPAIRLSDEQRLDWLRLIRSESVGPRTFRSLINRFGGARPALEALPDLLKQAGRTSLRVASRAEAEAEMQAVLKLGGHFIAVGEGDYPRALAAVDTAPPLIAVRGNIAALSRPMVAIVGSRNASAAGSRMAERLAMVLGQAGLVVVSGLARGIDTHAHDASIFTGTIAVLAGGLAKPYPSENEALLARMLEKGCVISEMPLASEPRARDFPRRNRIVSGLSLGTIVVEAARRSGSLITSRFALEQGREVFAVPGSPLDPRAEGTNDLIKSGATMVTTPQDVLEVLSPMMGTDLASMTHLKEGQASLDDEPLWDELDLPDLPAAPAVPRTVTYEVEAELDASPEPVADPVLRVEGLLGPAPIEIDELVRLAGMDTRAVQAALMELDLVGRLDRQGGNRVALRF